MWLKKTLHTLLRKSERYAKTDMVYLAHGGFWLTLWQASTTLSSFIISIMFANFLPKEVFGTYKFILSLGSIAGSLSLSGIGNAVTQAVAKGYERTLTAAFRINLKWGILITLASWGMSAYYFFWDNYVISTALFGIGIILPLYNSFILYGAFLNGKKEFKKNTLYGLALNFIPLVIIVGAFFVTSNPAVLAITSLSSGLFVAMFFYFRVTRTYNLGEGVSAEAISHGKKTSFMSILAVLATQIENILIFHYLGAASLAIYTLSLAFPQQIWNLFRSISTLALPKLTENKNLTKQSVRKKILTLSMLAAVITLCYILAAPLLFKIFFPQYPESVFPSQIVSLSILGVASIFPLTLLQATLKTKKVNTHILISSVFHIGMAIVLIPLWGMWGAMISFTTTKLLSLILSIFLTWNIGAEEKTLPSNKTKDIEF